MKKKNNIRLCSSLYFAKTLLTFSKFSISLCVHSSVLRVSVDVNMARVDIVFLLWRDQSSTCVRWHAMLLTRSHHYYDQTCLRQLQNIPFPLRLIGLRHRRCVAFVIIIYACNIDTLPLHCCTCYIRAFHLIQRLRACFGYLSKLWGCHPKLF